SRDHLAAARDRERAAALQVGDHAGIAPRAVILGADARHVDLAAVEVTADPDLLRAPGREGVVDEGRRAADDRRGAAVVLEAAALDQGDAGGRVDADADVL